MDYHLLFWALLLGSCGFALWRGQHDARVVAIACLSATLATKILISPEHLRFSDIEIGLLLIDGAMMATFLHVALHSTRFWPLWIAGLQLTGSLGHLMKAIDLDLMPKAYAIATAFWAYPILIILAIGTWRGIRRNPRPAPASLAT